MPDKTKKDYSTLRAEFFAQIRDTEDRDGLPYLVTPDPKFNAHRDNTINPYLWHISSIPTSIGNARGTKEEIMGILASDMAHHSLRH